MLLCPWNSPGKHTGVGSHSLLQGIFPTQGPNLGLLHWQAGSLSLVPYVKNQDKLLKPGLFCKQISLNLAICGGNEDNFIFLFLKNYLFKLEANYNIVVVFAIH